MLTGKVSFAKVTFNQKNLTKTIVEVRDLKNNNNSNRKTKIHTPNNPDEITF